MANCTKCNYPNDYQVEPYTCYECRQSTDIPIPKEDKWSVKFLANGEIVLSEIPFDPGVRYVTFKATTRTTVECVAIYKNDKLYFWQSANHLNLAASESLTFEFPELSLT